MGDRVFVPSLRASGDVLAVNERASEAEVQLGNFRLKFPIKRLELRSKATKTAEVQERVKIKGAGQAADSPGLELDLTALVSMFGWIRWSNTSNQAYMTTALGADYPRARDRRHEECSPRCVAPPPAGRHNPCRRIE